MRLRTLHAESMQEAMEEVRETYGDEVVIISTNRSPLGGGVSITIAEDDEEDDIELDDKVQEQIRQEHEYPVIPSPPTPSAPTNHSNLPDYFIRDIESILLKNGTTPAVTDIILSKMEHLPAPADDSETSIFHALSTALKESFMFEPIRFDKQGKRLMLIGAPGAGKTLTASKIIASITKQDQKVHAVTTDYKRAGGIEQLANITDILNVELHIAENRVELKSILADTPPKEHVIIDSAGSNPYEFQELKELAEFAGMLEIEPVLVYPAGCDPMEASEIAQAFSFLGVEKMIVTRTDVTKRYGSLLVAAHAANLSFSHVTGTEKILGDFSNMTPNALTSLLMRYRKEL